jgi:hypothetical protein
MQQGSVIREHRKLGPDVWCYRWWESGPSGKRVHRRIVLGTAEQLRDMASARQMTAGLVQEINASDIRMAGKFMTLAQLADHFHQRELGRSNTRLSHSTKRAYQGYLGKWIVPRWGDYLLPNIKAVEVELWLKHLERAAGTRCKIRNVMSVLFNHARRYDPAPKPKHATCARYSHVLTSACIRCANTIRKSETTVAAANAVQYISRLKFFGFPFPRSVSDCCCYRRDNHEESE